MFQGNTISCSDWMFCCITIFSWFSGDATGPLWNSVLSRSLSSVLGYVSSLFRLLSSMQIMGYKSALFPDRRSFFVIHSLLYSYIDGIQFTTFLCVSQCFLNPNFVTCYYIMYLLCVHSIGQDLANVIISYCFESWSFECIVLKFVPIVFLRFK